MTTRQQKEDERRERLKVLLGESLTRTAGAPVRVEGATTDDTPTADNPTPTGRPATIATWAPEDDEQVTTTLTRKGWQVKNHDPRIPDLGTGTGERAGGLLVPPATH